MPNARTRIAQYVRALCTFLLLTAAISCSVYDSSLLNVPVQRQDSGPPPTDGGHDSGMMSLPDGGDEDGAVSEPECTVMAQDEFCPVLCKERCNGQDDDCDGLVDETGGSKLCNLYAATSVCASGSCLIASCDRGHVDCNDDSTDGCEATLDSVEHCGLCTHRCELPNAVPECTGGSCGVASCNKGWDDCDAKPENGCERPLTSLTDCGGCGTSCKITHATTDCATQVCTFAACASGWGDCNKDASKAGGGDGCETDLGTPANCGGCGNACPADKPYCTGGKCTSIVCADGTADCNGDNNLCEVNLHSVDNCGACGVSCGSVANATVGCSDLGVCEPKCNPGFSSCDQSFANGCETNIRTLTNCGACGVSCSHVNGTSACDTGTCTLTGCNTGFGNCNGSAADGCEERLNSALHCGQCGRPCTLANAAANCSSGTCQVSTCNGGFGNCDANAANGCETNLQTTAAHCGACGAACAANFVCQGGRCVCDANSDCASGQACCNGACVDIRSNAANCGACGAVCASGQSCCSGTCKNLATDINNCGGCGRACGDNSDRCTNGACRCVTDSPCGAFTSCCSNGCHTPLLCR